MLTQPTPARLLAVVREELRNAVAPHVADPSAIAALGMADAVLGQAIWRCDRELELMREEIGEIGQLARRVVDAGGDADGAIREALALVGDLDDQDAVRRAYEAASEVLSRCIEATFVRQPELWPPVEALLERRLDREAGTDEFRLVGREGSRSRR